MIKFASPAPQALTNPDVKADQPLPSAIQLKKDTLTSEQFKALEQLSAPSIAHEPPVHAVPVQQAIDSAIKNKIEQQVNELDKARRIKNNF